jgi:hypothetical protein
MAVPQLPGSPVAVEVLEVLVEMQVREMLEQEALDFFQISPEYLQLMRQVARVDLM